MPYRVKLLLVSLAVSLMACGSALAAAPETGVLTKTFDSAPNYSATDVVARRLLLRIAYESISEAAAAEGKNLHALFVKPGDWKWAAYVPPEYDGSEAYGLVVSVSGSKSGKPADGWLPVLQDHKLIYVSVDGTDAKDDIMKVRVPLALIGLNGMLHQYKIDPKRIYVMGIGNGGKVAARMAVGFGDIFAGGLFIDGTDPIGTRELPIPAPTIFQTVAAKRHYAFVTGQRSGARATTLGDKDKFEDNCIQHAKVFLYSENAGPRTAGSTLDEAFGYLDQSSDAGATDAARSCIAKLTKQANEQLADARALLEKGQLKEAQSALADMHERFGGLNEEAALKLQKAIEAKQ